jgi:uncharacterized protein with FMN-binding domain
MKRAMLTSFVVLSFIAYSFHQHGGGDDGSTVVKPPTPKTTQTSPSTQPPTAASSGTTAAATYKNGQYTGSTEDAFYGLVRVMAVISGGRLTEVRFLQYPNDRSTSVQINSQAMPYLQQEAIKAQSAKVDIVSGATYTSQAFIQSLKTALNSARS